MNKGKDPMVAPITLIFPASTTALRKLLRRDKSLRILEPPHTHPSEHAQVADDLIAKARRGECSVVVTFSEPILHRIQRRIAEGVITADMVGINIAYDDGRVEATELDEYGYMTHYPKGVFYDANAELYAQMDAAQKKEAAK